GVGGGARRVNSGWRGEDQPDPPAPRGCLPARRAECARLRQRGIERAGQQQQPGNRDEEQNEINDRSPPDDGFHGYFTTISLTYAEPIVRLGLSAWCRTERAVAPARRPFEPDSGPQARRALQHSAGTAADWRRFFFNAFAARAAHDDPDCGLAPSLGGGCQGPPTSSKERTARPHNQSRRGSGQKS